MSTSYSFALGKAVTNLRKLWKMGEYEGVSGGCVKDFPLTLTGFVCNGLGVQPNTRVSRAVPEFHLNNLIDAREAILKLGPIPEGVAVEIGPDVVEWIKSNIPTIGSRIVYGASLLGMRLVHRQEPGWRIIN